jgi:hypothetical protein
VQVSAKLSDALVERLDAIAGAWGLNRAATIRRLVATADVDGQAPPPIPDLDELHAIAAEKARQGNMSAVSFLAARQPDARERELANLLQRIGASHD